MASNLPAVCVQLVRRSPDSYPLACNVTRPVVSLRYEASTREGLLRKGSLFVGRSLTSRISCIIASFVLCVACNGKTAGDVATFVPFVPIVAESFLPLDDYATALCDRAAACGAPFVESVKQATQDEQAGPGAPLEGPTADGDCPERLAAWMRTQPKASDECLTAMAATIRAHGCEIEPGIPAACEASGGGEENSLE